MEKENSTWSLGPHLHGNHQADRSRVMLLSICRMKENASTKKSTYEMN